jgi:imidazolonepropionase
MFHVLTHISELGICPDTSAPDDIALVRDAALVWQGDRIVWVGANAHLPAEYQSARRHDAGGGVVIPGLVDCHTHLAFAGWRADEFVQRSQGATYQEIAARGGGIRRTVEAVRQASESELTERAGGFLTRMTELGVTTVECKSGYGLTVEDELKLLRVYRNLQGSHPIQIVPTFLGAHVIPPEYRGDRQGYVRLVCEEMLPRVADERLARFCDVFVEEGAFSIEEARIILEAGKSLGLRPKLHADQLRDGGGARLASETEAISADHLECTSDTGLSMMARAGVVAVALPLASLYLGQSPLDARRCFRAGVRVAVATDFNPGSAPSYHLPFAMTLACTMNHMSPAQALKGATIRAAEAVGMARHCGSLEPGKRADFVILDAESVDGWLYHLRPNAARAVFAGGELIAGGLS